MLAITGKFTGPKISGERESNGHCAHFFQQVSGVRVSPVEATVNVIVVQPVSCAWVPKPVAVAVKPLPDALGTVSE